MPGHLLPPCFPSSLPFWHWIDGWKALNTLIRKPRLAEEPCNFPMEVTITSPCYTAKT